MNDAQFNPSYVQEDHKKLYLMSKIQIQWKKIICKYGKIKRGCRRRIDTLDKMDLGCGKDKQTQTQKKEMKKEVTETSKMKVKREREKKESSDHRVDVLIILRERRRHSGSHR